MTKHPVNLWSLECTGTREPGLWIGILECVFKIGGSSSNVSKNNLEYELLLPERKIYNCIKSDV